MSKTPLTDKEVRIHPLTTAYQAHTNAEPTDLFVHSDFARKLETQRDELLEALELILPMARGYALRNRVGNNLEMISFTEKAIAKVRGEA